MKITVELIAIELPQFGDAKTKDLDLAEGINLADALAEVSVGGEGDATLAMVNGEAVHRDEWRGTSLKNEDTVSLFRPFKGG
jgi:sulfur carrier protein ThiS